MRAPDYSGGGLVNLVAELEDRLTGRSASPPLRGDLAALVPDAPVYVLALVDGLGDEQLADHPEGALLRRRRRAALDASFSTQTSVATATLATGLPPSRHGLIAYLLALPGGVANTLWWFHPADTSPVDVDLESFLPHPNLAERLSAAGASTAVVEPALHLGGPLDRVLYRGARTIGVEDDDDLIRATLDVVAGIDGRGVVVVYLPHVDVAGHAEGVGSEAYAAALGRVTRIWERLAEGLPEHAVLLGTSDHGMVDVPPSNQMDLPVGSERAGLTLYGDSRVVYVQGDGERAARLAEALSATYLPFSEVADWWGPTPQHPEFRRRAPVGLLHAHDHHSLHPPGDGFRPVGHHGGATEAELRIPLLVAG